MFATRAFPRAPRTSLDVTEESERTSIPGIEKVPSFGVEAMLRAAHRLPNSHYQRASGEKEISGGARENRWVWCARRLWRGLAEKGGSTPYSALASSIMLQAFLPDR